MLLIEYVGHIGLRSLTDGHLGRHLEYFKTLNDARVASVGFIKYNASTTRINKEKNFKIKFQVILVFYRPIYFNHNFRICGTFPNSVIKLINTFKNGISHSVSNVCRCTILSLAGLSSSRLSIYQYTQRPIDYNVLYEYVEDFKLYTEGKKSLAIYFGDSHFRRNRTFNFIVSKIYVDKRS